MKRFLVVVHVALGLLIIFLSINSQIVTYRKIHDTARYYSPRDLRNRGVTEHLENLKRSELQNIIERVLGILLGASSIVAALASKGHPRLAVFAMPSITFIMIATVFYVGRLATGFDAAAYMPPVLVLSVLLALEVWYMLKGVR